MRSAMAEWCVVITVAVLACLLGCVRHDEAASPSGATSRSGTAPSEGSDVTENQRTVEKYLDGFRAGDHALVLSCLTEDVEWEIPGMFHVTGKGAFDKEIENEAFVGRPVITTTRLTEANGVVVAEGVVRAEKKEGGTLNVKFCDVFEMREGKIKRLTSYLMEVK